MEELRKLFQEAGRRFPEALARLEHYYDIELTYTSNAIEGNTLSAVETTLLIEKGITVSGGPFKDHLEALDHYDAIRYVRELGRHEIPITESDIRNLHRLVAQRSSPEIAGQYANLPRYVRTETGRHTFPSPPEIPPLMSDFARWLISAGSTPETAFAAHTRLVGIHPFNDGNGRTVRLLMNLILIRSGYPPIAVRPEDRLEYIRALQQEQSGQGANVFDTLLYRRLDETLADCLTALTVIFTNRREYRKIELWRETPYSPPCAQMSPTSGGPESLVSPSSVRLRAATRRRIPMSTSSQLSMNRASSPPSM